ncbi:hypothetical protein [Fictibacillus sp. NRS-1165]|uniref:hypothetical protein n=1 Tax=Fictibacillus sp. NRS-1165 TaxID=3144463 RepID=UPI003D239CD3
MIMRENADYESLSSICAKYFSEVISDFTNTAILLNASEVAMKRYRSELKVVGLSTIENIPQELRYPTDIDYRFNREELVEKYKEDIPKKIGNDYLIRSVSTIDAFLEDLYEYLLKKVFNPELSENEIKKKVRSAWSNNNMINFFLNEFQLTKPPKKRSTPDMAFGAYESWREIRHAYVHNKGKLGQKHITRLQELEPRLPEESHMSKSPVINGNRIQMNYYSILILRYWAYGFVTYLDYCLFYTLIIVPLIQLKTEKTLIEIKTKNKVLKGYIDSLDLDKEELVICKDEDEKEILNINDVRKVTIKN